MTISVPTASQLVSTNVVDPTNTYNPAINQVFPTGMKIQYNGWIYENTGAPIVPIVWTATGYPDGTVVYKDGKLQLWYSSPTTRLAQPEEYAIVDNGKYTDGNLFKANTWTHKYVNLGVIPNNQILYDPDFVGLPEDGSSYIFNTYINQNGETQTDVQATLEASFGKPPYNFTVPYFYTEVTDNSIDQKMTLNATDNKIVATAGTVYLRGTDLYMRTSADASTEYVSVTGGYGIDILSIAQMPGFVKKEPAKSSYPFDGKNYTYAEIENVMTYTIKGLEKFDTIALGRVKADTVDIVFKDPLGATVTSIIGATIDTSRDSNGNLAAWYTTSIFYSTAVMEVNSTVEITLYGAKIELGSILPGMSVDAGFTKLVLTNSYVDYSVVEENQFGNIDYVERGKISVYEGQCDIFVKDYDRTDRLMTSLGAKQIILNGSDAKNTVPDSQSVFSSTQKIGRLFNFKQMTQLRGKKMHQMATYSFTLKATI